MDQLWAPWRMTYIQQTDPEPGCLFCNQVREHADEKNHIVFRGPRCFVMLNLYPYNSGHLMVIPYQHTGELTELDPEVGAEIFTTSQLAVQVLGEAMHPEGYNLGMNQA